LQKFVLRASEGYLPYAQLGEYRSTPVQTG